MLGKIVSGNGIMEDILACTEVKWNIVPKHSDQCALRISVNRVLGKAVNIDIGKKKKWGI